MDSGTYDCGIWNGCVFLFFKQKTAYEMRISDWSSDVCSSDLVLGQDPLELGLLHPGHEAAALVHVADGLGERHRRGRQQERPHDEVGDDPRLHRQVREPDDEGEDGDGELDLGDNDPGRGVQLAGLGFRSEEQTSELQSLMRIQYAVFCLKKT